jgi:hypothetical protein
MAIRDARGRRLAGDAGERDLPAAVRCRTRVRVGGDRSRLHRDGWTESLDKLERLVTADR